ncbi:MAG: tRNA pseudouridine(38-40) synthase TruA [Haloarculaceae archaeon]
MTTRAYRVAYDGRPYHGFQRQPDVPTVEDEILDALRALDALNPGRDTPDGYAGAGRTDAGVSAVAQTVAFEAPDWLGPAALNSELPADVRAWASAEAPPDFHATHDATGREYTYFLHAPDCSRDRAHQALDALAGKHDFHNLTPDDEGTIRTLSTAIDRDGPFLVVTFRAGGFARQMVRRAVSVVAEVARGDADIGWVGRMLADEPLSGPEGVAPAPAYPLVLTDVTYPELDFAVDDGAAASAREVFEGRRVKRETAARVAGLLATTVPLEL